MSASSPLVTSARAIPVAGRDGMLMNLSGAHAPFFTRNLLILEDDAGHVGIAEIPGGEPIRKTLEQAGARRDLDSYKLLLSAAFARGDKPVRLLGVGVRLHDLRNRHEQLELFAP